MITRRGPRPDTDASHLVGIGSTGHGASVAYVGEDGRHRASHFERWSRTKRCLLLSEEEKREIIKGESDSPEETRIQYELAHGYGSLPNTYTFEQHIEPWTRWLLGDTDVAPEDIDLLVSSESQFAVNCDRLGDKVTRWFPNARFVTSPEHHELHQRQAFWPSGFDQAAFVTLDNRGEQLGRYDGRALSGTIGHIDQDGDTDVVTELFFPEQSAGLLYAAANHHIGFRLGEEGKTMGLAAYGGPDLYEELAPELELKPDGSFEFLGKEAFDLVLHDYVEPRDPEPGNPLQSRHADVAYAAQRLVERIVHNALEAAVRQTGADKLVYAGGVALNCVANQKGLERLDVDDYYIPPSPGDSGHGWGAALLGAYEIAGFDRGDEPIHTYLGPPYPDDAVEQATGRVPRTHRTRTDVVEKAARILANGHTVAIYQGSAEFGPRALGNRSILADPRRDDTQDYLNLCVKNREPFRPFAPSVLEEEADKWFKVEGMAPHMLRAIDIRDGRADEIPAVVHENGTSRIQTVSPCQNPVFHRLIDSFRERTGVPLVLNTSFNLSGDPIVERPEEAIICFREADLNTLLIGGTLIGKRPIPYYLETVRPAHRELTQAVEAGRPRA